jgi:hypothetical protein
VSVHVAFDIYPAADPNGSLLVRLLASGTGTKQAVELSARKVLHGSGEGMIRIHSSHAAATSANFTKRNYVKVVLVNGATETEWFGFFLEQGDFGAISRREQAGRMLTFSGPGSLFYLDRALLLAEIYAPGQPRRGNLEIDGTWGWNDIPYGAIMTRAMEEGYYAPGNPLFYATWDFSRDEDSASVAWPNIDNEFTVPWGTSVYDLIASFIKLGLVVTVDADLTFHAWQTYGTNRTSGTFAVGKIRFQHGVNIGNEVTRQIRASLERSHIFVVGDEFTSAVVSGGSSAVTYYDTLQKQETNDGATLTSAGTRDLDQREIQADAAFPVRVILDDDELNGLYVPGEHYDVGDIATIHTVPPSGASGEHDFTNFAIEVAAIKVEHDDAGNWFAVNELGAQYLSAQLSALEVPSSKIIHQIELCRVGGTPEFVDGDYEVNGPVGITIPADLIDSALYVMQYGEFAAPDCTLQTGGNDYPLTLIGSSSASGLELRLWRILSPPAGVGVTITNTVHDAYKGWWLLQNVDQTTPEASVPTNNGTGLVSSLTLAAGPSHLPINAFGSFAEFAPNFTPHVAGGSQTEVWNRICGAGRAGFEDESAGGYGSVAPWSTVPLPGPAAVTPVPCRSVPTARRTMGCRYAPPAAITSTRIPTCPTTAPKSIITHPRSSSRPPAPSRRPPCRLPSRRSHPKQPLGRRPRPTTSSEPRRADYRPRSWSARRQAASWAGRGPARPSTRRTQARRIQRRPTPTSPTRPMLTTPRPSASWTAARTSPAPTSRVRCRSWEWAAV